MRDQAIKEEGKEVNMSFVPLKTLVTRAYQVFRNRNTILHPPLPLPLNNQGTTDGHLHLNPEIKTIVDMMHSLTDDGVGLHRIYKKKVPPKDMITFIEVVHNSTMSVVIIVIPRGQRLPLHDHPSMMGLIKVLHGSVRLSAYSKVGVCKDRRQPAVKTVETVLSRLSYPQVLTPGRNNIHAIEFESGEGDKDYAAFLDILSPSYDDNVGCHYYSCNEEEGSGDGRQKSVKVDDPCTLIEVDCPKEYSTISMSYPFLEHA